MSENLHSQPGTEVRGRKRLNRPSMAHNFEFFILICLSIG